MRSLIITIFILILVKAVSSQVLNISHGTSIITNGVIGSNEWVDSDTVNIQSSSTTTTSVLYKHDGQYLNIAYIGNLQTPFFYFPELSIDANLDRSIVYQQDDWWFHVSATDCEYQGSYGNYNNCQLTRPNWLAQPNFVNNGPVINQVEVSIPLQTINVRVGDTIGILFYLNNFQNFRYHFSSANHLDPSSWQMAYLEPISTTLKENDGSTEIKLFPNPSSDQFHLYLPESFESSSILIRDIRGKPIWSNEEGSKGLNTIDLSDRSKGIYFLEMNSQGRTFRQKLVLK